MSVKIYEAWRTKEGVDLWKLIDHVRKSARPVVKAQLKELMDKIIENFNQESPEKQKELLVDFRAPTDATELRYFDLIFWLSQQYRVARASAQKQHFNFDLELAVRQFEGRYYLLPINNGILRKVFDFLNQPNDLVEDFSYWDNTDMPDGMKAKEWKTRGKTWASMDRSAIWHNVLSFSVMDLDWTFSNVMWEIVDEDAAERKLRKQNQGD